MHWFAGAVFVDWLQQQIVTAAFNTTHLVRNERLASSTAKHFGPGDLNVHLVWAWMLPDTAQPVPLLPEFISLLVALPLAEPEGTCSSALRQILALMSGIEEFVSEQRTSAQASRSRPSRGAATRARGWLRDRCSMTSRCGAKYEIFQS